MLKNRFFDNFKKIYLGIFIIFNLIAVIIFYKISSYTGDFNFHHDLKFNKILKYFIFYFSYIVFFKIFINFIYKNKIKVIKIKLDYFYLDYLVLILIIIRLILILFFNYGKVTGKVIIPGGTILINLFPVDYFFYFFYSLRRNSKIFIYNIILFSILQILLGWTYFLFIIGIFEITLKIKNKLKLRYLLSLIILGILSYSFLSPLKQKIRYSKEYKLEENFMLKGTEKLVARFSSFSNYVFLEENKEKISKIIKEKNESKYMYILEYYTMILPKKKLKLDNYETLNHILPNKFNNLPENLKGKISYDITLPGRMIIMYKTSGIIQTIIFLIFIGININFTIFLIKLYKNDYLKAINYIFLWLLFFSGNIQSFFKYQYSVIIFTILSIIFQLITINFKKNEGGKQC